MVIALTQAKPEKKSAYQSGHDGDEPILDLNNIYVYRPESPSGGRLHGIDAKIQYIMDTYGENAKFIIRKIIRIGIRAEVIPEKAMLREDYIEGLQEFVDSECGNIAEDFDSNLGKFLEGEGQLAFILGYRMLPLEIRKQNLPDNRFSESKYDSSQTGYDSAGLGEEDESLDDRLDEQHHGKLDKKPDVQQVLADLHTKPKTPADLIDSYVLGFAVGIAKDFGISLKMTELPIDLETYNDFMTGYNAIPVNLQNDSSSGQTRVNETIYLAGLKVWLNEQGLGAIESRYLRNPNALAGFIAALEGVEVEEFEKHLTETMFNSRVRMASRQSLAECDIFLDNESYKAWPSSETERDAALRGYKLGKIAKVRMAKANEAVSNMSRDRSVIIM